MSVVEKNDLPNFRDIDTKNILPELNHLIELARSSLEEAIKKKIILWEINLVNQRQHLRMVI